MVKDPLGLSGLGLGKKKPKRQPVAQSQKNEVLARQKYKCAGAKCNKPLDLRTTHFDHIKEVYKGGKSTVSNLQALCVKCHSLKTHKDNLRKVEKKRRKKSDNPFFSDGGLF